MSKIKKKDAFRSLKTSQLEMKSRRIKYILSLNASENLLEYIIIKELMKPKFLRNMSKIKGSTDSNDERLKTFENMIWSNAMIGFHMIEDAIDNESERSQETLQSLNAIHK